MAAPRAQLLDAAPRDVLERPREGARRGGGRRLGEVLRARLDDLARRAGRRDDVPHEAKHAVGDGAALVGARDAQQQLEHLGSVERGGAEALARGADARKQQVELARREVRHELGERVVRVRLDALVRALALGDAPQQAEVRVRQRAGRREVAQRRDDLLHVLALVQVGAQHALDEAAALHPLDKAGHARVALGAGRQLRDGAAHEVAQLAHAGELLREDRRRAVAEHAPHKRALHRRDGRVGVERAAARAQHALRGRERPAQRLVRAVLALVRQRVGVGLGEVLEALHRAAHGLGHPQRHDDDDGERREALGAGGAEGWGQKLWCCQHFAGRAKHQHTAL